MKHLIIKFIFFTLCIWAIPAKALEVVAHTEIEPCMNGYHCVTVEISNQPVKLLIDTGGAVHSLFYTFHQSQRALRPLYKKKHHIYKKYALHPVLLDFGGEEVMLSSVLLQKPEGFHNDYVRQGVYGIFHPQRFKASYVILDYHHNQFIALNGTSREVQRYLAMQYDKHFRKIRDYKRGKQEHIYVRGNVEGKKKQYFLLDTGAETSRFLSSYANANDIVGYGVTTTISNEINVQYATDILFNLSGLTFEPHPEFMVSETLGSLKKLGQFDHVNLYGKIGNDIISQTILVLPCEGSSGPIYISK